MEIGILFVVIEIIKKIMEIGILFVDIEIIKKIMEIGILFVDTGNQTACLALSSY